MNWLLLREQLDTGESLDDGHALDILQTPAGEIPEMLACATAVRRRRFGDRITACSIVNARSGACGEDCAFCAQSARHRTPADTYGLLNDDQLIEAYRNAIRHPIQHFGVVTSGGALKPDEVERISTLAHRTGEIEGVHWCASLGSLPRTDLERLRAAGVRRYHHNIETAPDFFASICSTHSFEERLATLRAARAAGMELCCGGILGMGESPEQRVAMARILAREAVDAIPLNFLVPIPGTRLETMPPMAPLDILRSVAMFRMVCPDAEIKVCAGRLLLRDLQSMVFYAGATGIMVGDLLTIAGRDPRDDRQLLRDLEALND